jgi:aminoglycoside/choline kinase family phosphotransferase
MQRQTLLQTWISELFPNETFSLAPASADASFRRYFRATFADKVFVVMDAPPTHEDCQPFLQIGKLFEAAGTHVPHVYAQDLAQGFLLLSDLGNTTYLQALTADTSQAKALYAAATDALLKIQLASQPDVLPVYDEALLRRELNLFPDWYINKHLGITLTEKQTGKLEECFQRIVRNNLAQPRVYVHRDYHSRNLMVTEPNPGILDFQDAVYGPITYDLASLFKDAYIRWEEPEIMDWLIRYWEKARKAGLPVREDFGEFYRDYEMMGAQRHLKVLGIFARLAYRDGKTNYLNDIPLVFDYLHRTAARYIDLKPLLNILDELVPKDQQEGFTF